MNSPRQRLGTSARIVRRSDEVFAILDAGRRLRFLALGTDKPNTDDIVLASAGFDAGADRSTETQLPTRLGPDALQKKLLKIAQDAKTAEDDPSDIDVSRTAKQGPRILKRYLDFAKTGNQVIVRKPISFLPLMPAHTRKS